MFVAWFAAQAVTLITNGMGSMAWPFALATAAVASLLSADAVARSMRSQSPAARMGASYAAAFIGFKLGILAWVALLDHGWSAFSGERSEEHTSELQSLMRISYAVFCLKKKTKFQYN